MDEATEPDLAYKGLSLWVLGRSFPEATEPYDADTLNCRAVADAPGARVKLAGYIASRDFHTFMEALEKLDTELAGTATLVGDLGVNLGIKMIGLGHLAVTIEMSADFGLSQEHRFYRGGDQTELRPLIAQCRRILERFPVMIELRH